MKNNRIAVIVGLVVVAAVIGFVAMRGGYPPKSGTEGTIGAADRYTSQQISDADVQLDSPEVQAFIQSDVFHKLATDKAFREAVDAGFAKDAFGNPKVDALLKTADGAKYLASDNFFKMANDLGGGRFTTEQLAVVIDAASAGTKPGQFTDYYMKDQAFKDALVKGDLAAIAKIDAAIAKDEAVKAAIDAGVFKDPALMDALVKSDAARGFVTDASRFSTDQMASVAEALNNKACVDALSKDGIRSVVESGFITEAMKGFQAEQMFKTDANYTVLKDALAKTSEE